MTNIVKVCTICRKEHNSTLKDLCKICYQREYIRNNPEMRRKNVEYNAAWCKKNPERHRFLIARSIARRNKESIYKKLERWQKVLPELKISFQKIDV